MLPCCCFRPSSVAIWAAFGLLPSLPSALLLQEPVRGAPPMPAHWALGRVLRRCCLAAMWPHIGAAVGALLLP